MCIHIYIYICITIYVYMYRVDCLSLATPAMKDMLRNMAQPLTGADISQHSHCLPSSAFPWLCLASPSSNHWCNKH